LTERKYCRLGHRESLSLAQSRDQAVVHWQRPTPSGRLGSVDHDLTASLNPGLSNVEHASLPVDIAPSQAEDFAASKTQRGQVPRSN
jgi:hypothetical protein